MEHRAAEERPHSVYREFAPRPELREYVRALAWFGPATATARPATRELFVAGNATLPPVFADAHASIAFDLPATYRGGTWRPSAQAPSATVMGAITHASPSPGGDRAAMIGVYLSPRGISDLLGVPGSDVADRVVPLDDIWRGVARDGEFATLDSVEELLMRRLCNTKPTQRTGLVAAMARYVRRNEGRVTVTTLSEHSGFSRQHVRRLFREQVGIGPKLYARLARFRTALTLMAQREPPIGWSRLSARLGYADQSHFIADFREFTSFTPEQLARGVCFHPFIGDRTAGNGE